jgi:hypothetical protein
MGTPCACIYATNTYGCHKQTKILPHRTKNLALLGRFIDDMLGIWTRSEEEWPHFKESLQGFDKLMWIYSDLSSSVVFLDLTLSFTAENTITSPPPSFFLTLPFHSQQRTPSPDETLYTKSRNTQCLITTLIMVVPSITQHDKISIVKEHPRNIAF